MSTADDLAADLAGRRARFVWPLLTAGLGLYTTALLVLGYGEGLVTRPLIGSINVAYVLPILLIVMTMGVALVYERWARRTFDPRADALRELLENDREHRADGGPRGSDTALQEDR